MTTLIKTRLFLISDTHSLAKGNDTAFTDDYSFRQPFPVSDVLIHSGDLTSTGQPDEYRAALRLLKSIPSKLKLVIAGNHDLSLDRHYYLDCPKPNTIDSAAMALDPYYNPAHADEAEMIWNGPEAKDAGVTYLAEGVHTFNLANGAKLTVYASPWQPTFFDWAFNYAHNEDRWNPPHLISQMPNPRPVLRNWRDTDAEHEAKIRIHQKIIPGSRDPHPIPEDANVDIVITHGPPWKHLDECKSGDYAGCPQLLQAIERVRPRLHVFGHIHEAWGAERVTWPANGKQTTTNPKWYKEDYDPLGESRTVIGSLFSDIEDGIQTPFDEDVKKRGSAYIDVSSDSGEPLKVGVETLLVNPCIKDFRYHSHQAGWLVDIDLPIDPAGITSV